MKLFFFRSSYKNIKTSRNNIVYLRKLLFVWYLTWSISKRNRRIFFLPSYDYKIFFCRCIKHFFKKTMYPTRRKIPMSVSVWMEKDVNVRKATASAGLMPNDTRSNAFLCRKFHSDMLNLSSERHRKLARFDYNKKTFIKNQRHKAETKMPGLLPYVSLVYSCSC
jgi:hypothetical protein